MTHSYATHLSCPKCKNTYSIEGIHQLCSCGSPLLVRYDLAKAKSKVSKESLSGRESTLWRYHEFLPVLQKENIVSLGEGFTPITSLNRLGSSSSLPSLFLKDEGLVPSGSFKARGAAVGISKAKELVVTELAMPTNGNAGAAWSLYAAKAGITAHIVMPIEAPEITRKEVLISGGKLYLINGLISDAGKAVAAFVQEHGCYDASTLKEPYRIEGKKTMGYEIAEQFNWSLPDVILYPTGGGVGLIGIYKAFRELQELGWLENDKLPRLVAVQSEGCAPIVKAHEAGESSSVFWEDSQTKAFGINVPKALGDFLVLEAIAKTNGTAIAVSEADIEVYQRKVAQEEGQFICPEGAATIAAAMKLRESNWISEDEQVLCLNTGMGIKYPETVLSETIPTLEKGDRIKEEYH